MPPYWDNKALPTPTQYFIFNFLIISFIFIKNKCFSDVIWNLKREEKKFAKRQIQTRVDRVKRSSLWHTLYHLRHWSWRLLAILCNVD